MDHLAISNTADSALFSYSITVCSVKMAEYEPKHVAVIGSVIVFGG